MLSAFKVSDVDGSLDDDGDDDDDDLRILSINRPRKLSKLQF